MYELCYPTIKDVDYKADLNSIRNKREWQRAWHAVFATVPLKPLPRF
jgi:hypothetical protein